MMFTIFFSKEKQWFNAQETILRLKTLEEIKIITNAYTNVYFQWNVVMQTRGRQDQ